MLMTPSDYIITRHIDWDLLAQLSARVSRRADQERVDELVEMFAETGPG